MVENPPVKATIRRRQIIELLRRHPVEVEELAVRFTVSPSTIRRDLAKLTEEGAIVRTYGGAVTGGKDEPPLHERELRAQAEKSAIARLAEEFIEEGDFVLLDAGTTTGALAARLATRHDLTVATNGLTAVNALADAEGVRLMVLGGLVRHISLGMVGPAAESMLAGITADSVFLGADGVVAGRGLCEATQEQASLKRLMVAQSREVHVLADASKLGNEAQHFWTPLERPWHLITDARATADQLAPFLQNPLVTVHIAAQRGNGGRPPAGEDGPASSRKDVEWGARP
jgi:DeoR/GlpR family transcriptional regulator of sugar metabolism